MVWAEPKACTKALELGRPWTLEEQQGSRVKMTRGKVEWGDTPELVGVSDGGFEQRHGWSASCSSHALALDQS